MRTGICSGSFDPLTNGHLWVIHEAARIFDKVHVVLGMVPGKPGTFSQDARFAMMKESINLPNVVVEIRHGKNIIEHIATIAEDPANIFLVRGMRDEEDFLYESKLTSQARGRNKELGHVFLIPPDHLRDTSSSEVRNWWFGQGWDTIVDMVPPPVLEKIKAFSTLKSMFETGTAGFAPAPSEGFKIRSTKSLNGRHMPWKNYEYRPKSVTFFGKMKDHFNLLVSNELIGYRTVIDASQVRAMLDPCPIDLVVSKNFHLIEIPIGSVSPTGKRYLPCSQSLGPIIVEANHVLGPTSEYGELGPAIIIEGKHRWLDAKERGEENIMAWVGDKAIHELNWINRLGVKS